MRPGTGSLALLLAAILVSDAVAPDHSSLAQSRPSTGVGFQVGMTTGLSLRYVPAREPVFDVLVARDLDGFTDVNLNAVWERQIKRGANVDLRMFYGPGLFFGFRNNDADDVVLGVGFAAGPSLWAADRFEFFAQLMPLFGLRFQLQSYVYFVPVTDFVMGGGLGVRYHFFR